MSSNVHNECKSCCDHGEGSTVYDLPIPLELREEWRRLATRRHFLGSMGKTLGWASLATLFGSALTPPPLHAATDSIPNSTGHYVPDFTPKAKGAIYPFISGTPAPM